MLKRFFNTHKRFIKFLFVGGLNTIFGYSVFSLLIFLGLYYPFAAIISTIIGILFNFKTTGKIVFNNSESKLLFKFIRVYMTTCTINIACLRIFEIFKYNMYIAGAILIFPLGLLSFILNKRFVFKSEKK